MPNEGGFDYNPNKKAVSADEGGIKKTFRDTGHEVRDFSKNTSKSIGGNLKKLGDGKGRGELVKKAVPWFVPVGLAGLWIWANREVRSGAQEAEESGVVVNPSSEEIYELGKTEELDAYAKRGIGSQLGYSHIRGVNESDFLVSDRDNMVNFSAKFGPSFLFATYSEDLSNSELSNLINPVLVKEMAEQTGYSESYLNSIWIQARDSRDFALDILQKAPKQINPKTMQFFIEADRLIDNDLTPETSLDIREKLIEWLNANTTSEIQQTSDYIGRIESENYSNGEDFNEMVGIMCEATGLDFALIRGSMETVGVCGGDAVEMVSSYAHIPDVNSSAASEMEMSSSAYILIPLFLLRIGNHMVKDFGRKTKEWLDKREYRQMFNELKEAGKKFLA